jgi:hypothetical protein
MPMAVFLVGNLFGTEAYTSKRMANMVVVTIGVAIAAYGEINFVLIGVILQLISIAVEATRLTMVQVGDAHLVCSTRMEWQECPRAC